MEHKVNRILLIILSVIAVAACVGCLVGIGFSSYRCAINPQSNAVPVFATINNYEKHTALENYEEEFIYYNLLFQYISSDGTIYSDVYERGIVNFDYVEKMLGQKCTIYVDQKHKILLNEYGKDYSAIVLALLVPLFVVLIIYSAILIKTIDDYYKNKKQLNIKKSIKHETVRKSKINYNCKNQNNIKDNKDGEHQKPSKIYLISLIVMYIMGAAFVAFACDLPEAIDVNKKIENADFEKVQATIVCCQALYGGNNKSLPTFYACYEYEDQNGKIYSGLMNKTSMFRKDILDLIGSKVNIYIDSTTGLHYEILTQSMASYYIVLSIFVTISGVAFIIALVFFVRYISLVVKWNKYQNDLIESQKEN